MQQICIWNAPATLNVIEAQWYTIYGRISMAKVLSLVQGLIKPAELQTNIDYNEENISTWPDS
jgi:hypothetical protein